MLSSLEGIDEALPLRHGGSAVDDRHLCFSVEAGTWGESFRDPHSEFTQRFLVPREDDQLLPGLKKVPDPLRGRFFMAGQYPARAVGLARLASGRDPRMNSHHFPPPSPAQRMSGADMVERPDERAVLRRVVLRGEIDSLFFLRRSGRRRMQVMPRSNHRAAMLAGGTEAPVGVGDPPAELG